MLPPLLLCVCVLTQIAGGYYGQKPVEVEEETGVVATTPGADNKKKGWPVRLLTAYIVRPGELLASANRTGWLLLLMSHSPACGSCALSTGTNTSENTVVRVTAVHNSSCCP